MFTFQAIRQFFSSPSVIGSQPSSPALSVADLTPAKALYAEWLLTKGRFYQLQQHRHVTCRNSEISGTCRGQAGELVGSAMISLFKGLPDWLPTLLIKLSVRADEGELTVSVCNHDGTIIRATAPSTLEAQVELVAGHAWLRCEAGLTPVRNLRYEATII